MQEEIKWLEANGFKLNNDHWVYKNIALELDIYINGYDRISILNLGEKKDGMTVDELLEIADLIRVWHRKFGNKKKGKKLNEKD